MPRTNWNHDDDESEPHNQLCCPCCSCRGAASDNLVARDQPYPRYNFYVYSHSTQPDKGIVCSSCGGAVKCRNADDCIVRYLKPIGQLICKVSKACSCYCHMQAEQRALPQPEALTQKTLAPLPPSTTAHPEEPEVPTVRKPQLTEETQPSPQNNSPERHGCMVKIIGLLAVLLLIMIGVYIDRLLNRLMLCQPCDIYDPESLSVCRRGHFNPLCCFEERKACCRRRHCLGCRHRYSFESLHVCYQSEGTCSVRGDCECDSSAYLEDVSCRNGACLEHRQVTKYLSTSKSSETDTCTALRNCRPLLSTKLSQTEDLHHTPIFLHNHNVIKSGEKLQDKPSSVGSSTDDQDNSTSRQKEPLPSKSLGGISQSHKTSESKTVNAYGLAEVKSDGRVASTTYAFLPHQIDNALVTKKTFPKSATDNSTSLEQNFGNSKGPNLVHLFGKLSQIDGDQATQAQRSRLTNRGLESATAESTMKKVKNKPESEQTISHLPAFKEKEASNKKNKQPTKFASLWGKLFGGCDSDVTLRYLGMCPKYEKARTSNFSEKCSEQIFDFKPPTPDCNCCMDYVDARVFTKFESCGSPKKVRSTRRRHCHRDRTDSKLCICKPPGMKTKHCFDVSIGQTTPKTRKSIGIQYNRPRTKYLSKPSRSFNQTCGPISSDRSSRRRSRSPSPDERRRTRKCTCNQWAEALFKHEAMESVKSCCSTIEKLVFVPEKWIRSCTLSKCRCSKIPSVQPRCRVYGDRTWDSGGNRTSSRPYFVVLVIIVMFFHAIYNALLNLK